jgi:3-oxoacyl-[acyl-carrier-protein] synthase III
MANINGLRIVGFGAYRPEFSRPSSQLDEIYKKPFGWTQEKFKIASRPIANRDETTSFMASKAIKEALKMANWQDFDMLIGGCGVMEQPIPSTAVLVQKQLGLEQSGIMCLDVNMTCLSFLAGLDVASQYMQTSRIKKAIIFASDIASAGLDYNSPHASAIFGDGAAAICIESHDEIGGGEILATRFKTFSTGIDTAHLRAGGTKIRIEDGYDALSEGAKFFMDPTGIFRAAGRYLPKIVLETLKDAKLGLDDIDVFICHQASSAGLEFMRHLVKSRPERIIDIFENTGNQIAASLPTALYNAHSKGLLKPKTNVLMLGTSAGISIGAMVLRI